MNMNPTELALLASLNNAGLAFDGTNYNVNGQSITPNDVNAALAQLVNYLTDAQLQLQTPNPATLLSVIQTLAQI